MKQGSRSLDSQHSSQVCAVLRHVQANVALQEAAQKVVNENRDLRKLLHQQGLSDHDIQTNLLMLRTSSTGGGTGARVEPAKTWNVVPQPAPDSSQTTSEYDFTSFLVDATAPHGAGYPDPFGTVFSAPDVDSLQNLASAFDSPAMPSPAMQTATDPSPLSSESRSPPTEMDICCSSFLPPYTTVPTTRSEGALSTDVAGDKSSSTPCTVAYALLTALNSRRHQQQDMLLITLELLNGFRVAPEGDPEGCRVDNNVLIPVMDRLLAG